MSSEECFRPTKNLSRREAFLSKLSVQDEARFPSDTLFQSMPPSVTSPFPFRSTPHSHYRVGETEPVVGGRVLVLPARAHGRHRPYKLHDSAPQSHDKEKKIQIKTVIVALDSEPVLDPDC